MQVVAALNPIAGEKMQEELEERISALQKELDRAHTEVRSASSLPLQTSHIPAASAQIHATSILTQPDSCCCIATGACV